MRVSRRVPWVLALVVASGCVYPRRSTSISPVTGERAREATGAPEDVWSITIVGAHVRPRKSGDLAWDEDGEGLPDVFVRFFRDGEQLFETETIDDSLTPEWNATIEQNVRLSDHSQIRIEVWDADTVGSDPVGIYDRRGLPPMAIEGADARIMLEGGSWLTIRRERPRPHRGLGIAQYEVRPDRLVLLDVMTYSPAYRAGLRDGDEVTRIGDRAVSEMNDGAAASALSMAASRHEPITYSRAGREETVELDNGFVWLTR